MGLFTYRLGCLCFFLRIPMMGSLLLTRVRFVSLNRCEAEAKRLLRPHDSRYPFVSKPSTQHLILKKSGLYIIKGTEIQRLAAKTCAWASAPIYQLITSLDGTRLVGWLDGWQNERAVAPNLPGFTKNQQPLANKVLDRCTLRTTKMLWSKIVTPLVMHRPIYYSPGPLNCDVRNI